MFKLSRAQFNAAEEEIRHLKQELAQRDGRIEQLEAALRYIIDEWADEYETGGLENFCRAALGEKKDD